MKSIIKKCHFYAMKYQNCEKYWEFSLKYLFAFVKMVFLLMYIVLHLNFLCFSMNFTLTVHSVGEKFDFLKEYIPVFDRFIAQMVYWCDDLKKYIIFLKMLTSSASRLKIKNCFLRNIFLFRRFFLN